MFDAGLCVQLYAFVLDYMGQMSSFGAADFAEPLLWGRLDYDNAAQNSDQALPMPRTLIMLVVGTPAQVDRYTALLDEGLATSEALKGLRGPQEGQLTYTADGQTVTQQPFGFESFSARIERPGWTCLTRLSEGAALSVSGCTLETDGQAATVTLDGDSSGASVTVSLPVTQESGAASADLSGLTASVSVEAALILTDTLPTTAQAGEGQVIALRDTQYVFTREDEAFRSGGRQSPFTLSAATPEDGGTRLSITVSADEAALAPGYYRVLVSADLSGAQVEWEDVPWAAALGVRLTNEQISAWEQFAEAVHTYDGDSAGVPRQLQHAWGPVNESGYHGLPIPDFPPVMRAPGLEELIAQLRPEAIAVEELFFSNNITTGIAVAHARGIILCTAAKSGIPLFEYTPMQVKQAVVGYGLAEKRQVMDMVRRLLKLKAVPRPDDAADALALAICHARSATSLLARAQNPVKQTV